LSPEAVKILNKRPPTPSAVANGLEYSSASLPRLLFAQDPLAQKTRDAVFIVMTDDRGGCGLDLGCGIGWGIGLIGAGEHAQVVIAVAKTDHPANAELLTQYLDSSRAGRR